MYGVMFSLCWTTLKTTRALRLLTEQGHQSMLWTDRAPVVKPRFLLITFSCANKISPTHLSCPNSSTHKWAVFHKTQTLRAVAKCWGLPLSLLPKLPNCFQRWPAIRDSHARIQAHTQAQFRSKWSEQTHGHLEEEEKKPAATNLVLLMRRKWASPCGDTRRLIPQ